MIGFIIKKAFFDTWDNLFKVVGLNLGFLPCLGLTYLGVMLVAGQNYWGFAVLFFSLVLMLMHLGTSAYLVRDIGNSKFNSMKDYLKYFKEDFRDKLLFSLSWSLFIIVAISSISFYLKGSGMLTTVPLALVFWFSLTISVAVLFFYPIKTRLAGDFRKVIKKCFILLFDNPGAAIFTFVYSVVLLLLSIPTAGLVVPGLTSILMVVDNTTHMYELKYDYLEKNPEADSKNIPWKEITYDLNENIGPRTIRGMIFPWKN